MTDNPSLERETLEGHSIGRLGKIEIVATKPMAAQQDLACLFTGHYGPSPAIDNDPAIRRGAARCRLLQRDVGYGTPALVDIDDVHNRLAKLDVKDPADKMRKPRKLTTCRACLYLDFE